LVWAFRKVKYSERARQAYEKCNDNPGGMMDFDALVEVTEVELR